MRNTKTLNDFEGLSYVTISNVPTRKLANGETVLDISPHELERRVAIAIIEKRIPIKGQELKVIKSALRMNFDELGMALYTTPQTVKNWARKFDARLQPGAEVMFRAMATERLGVSLRATLSDLLADKD